MIAMKKYVTSIICLIMLAIATFATAASIVNSKHDIRHIIDTHDSWGFNTGPRLMINQYGEVCVYCHTPHKATVQAPLWNRNSPTGPYTPYNSATIVPNSIPNMPNPMSLVCLSCHDGTIAVDSIINAPGSGANLAGPWYDESASQAHPAMLETTGVGPLPEDGALGDECGDCHKPGGGFIGNEHDAERAYLTTTLSNDHPISMTYPTAAQDPFFQNVTSVPGSGLKLFSGNTIECPSCHDVHDPGISPFLRISDSGSALCKVCHIK